MTVNRTNWFVRWCFIFDRYIPTQTTLCALFWRGIVGIPAILIALGMVTAWTIAAAITNPDVFWEVMKALGFSLAILGGLIVLVMFGLFSFAKLEDSVPVQAIRSVKKKYCPIVQINR